MDLAGGVVLEVVGEVGGRQHRGLGIVAVEAAPKLAQVLLSKPPRAGEDEEVRPGEGGKRLPESPPWQAVAVPEGAGGVHDEDVQVPPYLQVAEAVVQHQS